MTDPASVALDRRDFIKLAGLATAGAAVLPADAAVLGSVAIAVDLRDPILASAPVAWAVNRFRAALAARGITIDLGAHGQPAYTVTISRIAAGPEDVHLTSPTPMETIVASGGARGLVYGLLELAERVEASDDPFTALKVLQPLSERPASRVRSLLRAYCSKVEDPVWFYDKQGWSRYLDLVVASRFNRVQLAFGFGWGLSTRRYRRLFPLRISLSCRCARLFGSGRAAQIR